MSPPGALTAQAAPDGAHYQEDPDAILEQSSEYRKGLRWRALLVLIYSASVMLYVAIGGTVLVALEEGPERDRLRDLERETLRANLSAAQRSLLSDLGVCTFRDPDVPDTGYYWTYEGGFLFTLTVVTTIGYGDTAVPHTTAGRLFTMLYAIVGIAVVLSALMRIAALLMELALGVMHRSTTKFREAMGSPRAGRRMTAIINFADARMPFLSQTAHGKDSVQLDELLLKVGAVDPATGEVKCDVEQLQKVLSQVSSTQVSARTAEHVFRCAAADADRGSLDGEGVRRADRMYRQLVRNQNTASVSAFLTALTAVCGWVAAWSPYFSTIEDWTMMETFWFSFITLTTVGLGDFAPTHRRTRWALWVFILPGLGLTGWCLGAVNQLYVRYMRDRALRQMHERGLLSLRALEVAGAATDLEVRIKHRSERLRAVSVASSGSAVDTLRRGSVPHFGVSPPSSPLAEGTPPRGRRPRNVSFTVRGQGLTVPGSPADLRNVSEANDALRINAADIARMQDDILRLRHQRQRLQQRRAELAAKTQEPKLVALAPVMLDDWDFDIRQDGDDGEDGGGGGGPAKHGRDRAGDKAASTSVAAVAGVAAPAPMRAGRSKPDVRDTPPTPLAGPDFSNATAAPNAVPLPPLSATLHRPRYSGRGVSSTHSTITRSVPAVPLEPPKPPVTAGRGRVPPLDRSQSSGMQSGLWLPTPTPRSSACSTPVYGPPSASLVPPRAAPYSEAEARHGSRRGDG